MRNALAKHKAKIQQAKANAKVYPITIKESQTKIQSLYWMLLPIGDADIQLKICKSIKFTNFGKENH